jgi:small-conductance mechanosensitive channel
MQMLNDWGTALSVALTQIIERATQYLPSVLGAFLILLLGWVVAHLLRGMAVRSAILIDRLLSRMTARAHSDRSGLPPSSAKILGSIVFWVVLLFFFTAATQALGLNTFAAWFAGIVNYVPALIAGMLIVAAGFLLSRLARDLVLATSAIGGTRQRELFARAVQAVILVTAMLVGAEQIGIKITFLVIIAAATGGTIAVSVALALSLGARSYVANLIGGHHLRRTFSVGQVLRVAGFEGRILEMTPVTLVLETAEGRVTLPAKVFGEEPIVLKIGGADHAGQ